MSALLPSKLAQLIHSHRLMEIRSSAFLLLFSLCGRRVAAHRGGNQALGRIPSATGELSVAKREVVDGGRLLYSTAANSCIGTAARCRACFQTAYPQCTWVAQPASQKDSQVKEIQRVYALHLLLITLIISSPTLRLPRLTLCLVQTSSSARSGAVALSLSGTAPPWLLTEPVPTCAADGAGDVLSITGFIYLAVRVSLSIKRCC